MALLNASDLLAGGELIHQIDVPPSLLAADANPDSGVSSVRIKPLTVKDLQLITRAARDNDNLTSALMVQTALVEPALELREVYRLPVGLMDFLVDEINRISGIGLHQSDLESAAEEPLLQAAFLLSREFGWTPEQISELTLGQLLVNLQLLKEKQATA